MAEEDEDSALRSRAAPPGEEAGNHELQLLKLGQELMEEVRPKLATKLQLADAVQYRDGLIIAFAAFFPLRRRNIAALDLVRHFQQNGDACTIVIPRTETKTGTPIEFDIPSIMLPYLDEYRTLVRPRISPENDCTALWVSPTGGPLTYSAFGPIFARHSARRLGVRLGPHAVRAAAATTWGVFSPEQIDVAQELLAHRDIRTTTTHYNRARGIQASRAYSQALRHLRN